MEKDAASAGVAPVGGLFSTAEIKILICYILTELNEPVPTDGMVNLLHYEGIANAFEVSDAFHSLEKSGMIFSPENDGRFTVTEQGKSVHETLKDSIPITVKNRALTATKKMLTRNRNAENSDISITHEDGMTYVTCTALDRKKPLLSIKMVVVDDAQGQRIKDRFLENSTEICSTVINLLTCESE